MNWIEKILQLKKRPLPQWDWLQVEVSSRCPAACLYCPTALYREDGSNLIMPLDVYEKLLPAFSRTGLVYLQGWGEPFLNPHFFDMVRLAKNAGCRVGTTTNSMLLDEEILGQLVHSGVDLIAFSLAGCAEMNDVLRKGTRQVHVLETIRRLNEIKEKEHSLVPEIHIAYLLMRSGLDELERLPGVLAGLGVAQVVISTLDFVPLPELESETLISANVAKFDALRARLDEVAAAGKDLGIDVHYQISSPVKDTDPGTPETVGEMDLMALFTTAGPVCTENIQRAAFISAGGDVAPCVFYRLPVAMPEVVTEKTGKPYHPLVFGNLDQQNLDEIWQLKNYRDFRRALRDGRLNLACQACAKTHIRVY